jgi:hypothetical protein
MRKFGLEAHKFSCRRGGSLGMELILVFMRKFGLETHVSFHVVGKEVWA